MFDPHNPDADGSGMFHVKLSDWEVVEEIEHKSKNPGATEVSIKLRRRGVDDQGRTGGQGHAQEAR